MEEQMVFSFAKELQLEGSLPGRQLVDEAPELCLECSRPIEECECDKQERLFDLRQE